MLLFDKSIATRCLLLLLFGATSAASEPDLNFASWGGAYMQAQQRLLAVPFAARTGLQVNLLAHNGSLDALRQPADWDGISLLRAQAEAGCREGLLRPFDAGKLDPAPDGRPASDDFLPGLLLPCAVGETVWSFVLAFAAEQFSAAPPAAIAALFDPLQYPGYRALHRHPRGLLEWALLADGVEAQAVYTVLETSAGLDRAFRQLDRIRPWIRWWRRLDEPVEWLAGGEVSMAAVFSDHYLQRLLPVRERYPLLWDAHLWQATYWAIPAEAVDADNAERFVVFASSTAMQAERMRYVPQGPARDSAVRAHHSPYRSDLPTWPENFARGLEWNLAWWQAHGEAARQRFAEWLLQPVTGVPIEAAEPIETAAEVPAALPWPAPGAPLSPKPR